MKIKGITKLLILALALIVCLPSCSLITELREEAEKASEFTADFAALVQDPSVEKAEELVHPSSPLTADSVIEKLEDNEKLKSLDLSQEIKVGEIGDVKLSYKDEELGGNVYSVTCQILVGDTPVDVDITLLSTDEGFGLYDFNIK